MKRNQGFTLIELIIVIVILGILAVTAAPRFLNFSGDAKASTLSGVRGALESAGALVYGKAIIAGKHTEATETLTDPAIAIVYGYPAATEAAIRAAAELSTGEWAILPVTTAGEPAGSAADDIVIATAGTDAADLDTLACHVLYKPATASTGTPVVVTKPVITVVSSGC
ncbi:prepilin-type N-terminal cleavage/methylation domain-containing protein [Rheinheimera hassiensis]|uniref:prepilin-type N-terminal cleavage/methylation domain-containing protein n=1 Tax=Rheinheimera hassiensis TaxID=1193627 RepID=UPI001F0540E5|nr:prepilin-type N-terminal cleavage/methylation domain-containing protein [Rheinheimera hassiensis]